MMCGATAETPVCPLVVPAWAKPTAHHRCHSADVFCFNWESGSMVKSKLEGGRLWNAPQLHTAQSSMS